MPALPASKSISDLFGRHFAAARMATRDMHVKPPALSPLRGSQKMDPLPGMAMLPNQVRHM
jgi:hypothetical protein